MKKLVSSLLVCSSLFLGAVVAEAQDEAFNARMVTVADTTSYLTIDGKSLGSAITGLELDGRRHSFSKVSDDGQIIKTEFDGRHRQALLTLADGRQVRREIAGIYNTFPYRSGGETKAPDLVWGHVTIPVWDFHKVAKDAAGRELRYPEKTTFAVEEAARPIDAISQATAKEKDDSEGKTPAIAKKEDLQIRLDLSQNADRQFYHRLKNVFVEGRAVPYTRKKEGDVGMITIKVAAAPWLAEQEEVQVELQARALKKRTLTLPLQKVSEPAEDPNPAETPDPNPVEAGQDVVFTYQLSQPQEAQKYAALTGMTRVWADGHEEELNFLRRQEGKVGKIIVDYGTSRPIQTEGSYTVKLLYRGLRPETRTVTAKAPSPVIQLNSNNGAYINGRSLLFTLKNFHYTFQQDTGVQAVWLNGKELKRRYVVNPDENVAELQKQGIDAIANEEGNPFHVVGNLLRIKNDGLKALQPGLNRMTVKFDRYHDAKFTFVLGEAKVKEAKMCADAGKLKEQDCQSPLVGQGSLPALKTLAPVSRARVDVMSGATSGGTGQPSVGGDGSGGGSVNMGAKVAYDFDMIANAQILENLGYKGNSSVKSTLDFWEGTAKEVAVYKDNFQRKVIWDDYLNYVQYNRLHHGVYKSFLQYYQDPQVEITQNAPYQIKYYVGTGLGQPIFVLEELNQDYQREPEKTDLKPVPKNALAKLDHVKVRTDVTLSLVGWGSAIESISLDGKVLKAGQDYQLHPENSEFTILGKNFVKEGSHRLVIKAKGFETVDRSFLVRQETKEDSAIYLDYKRYPRNTIFTGDSIHFDITQPQEVRVTGVQLSYNGAEPKELSEGTDYSYAASLGQLEIFGKRILQPGAYTVQFTLAGRQAKSVSFQVVGEELHGVKVPIKNDTAMRMRGSGVNFRFENYTGNREIMAWLDSITEIRVNGEVAQKDLPTGQGLRYEIIRDKDQKWDASSALEIGTAFGQEICPKGGAAKIEIRAKDYATLVLEYDLKVFPAENRQVTITQLDPKTGEVYGQSYNKWDYLPAEPEIPAEPPFDEKAMAEKFPGMNMKLDLGKPMLVNDGQFANFGKWLEALDKVELNGRKIGFGPNGVVVGMWSNPLNIKIYAPLHKGDVLSFYAQGYEPYEYFVR